MMDVLGVHFLSGHSVGAILWSIWVFIKETDDLYLQCTLASWLACRVTLGRNRFAKLVSDSMLKPVWFRGTNKADGLLTECKPCYCGSHLGDVSHCV